MDYAQQLEMLKLDYIRLQGDLEKRESTSQQVDPLIKQLEVIEQQIAEVRAKLSTSPCAKNQ
ncbi:SE1832 family protein [Staphylococcus americanisciuri]|uniref:SE1832 family protein n=1 Tax=Staphylococcus americanisciuri TaxID=2973940 RepID=A0ABT2F0N0_9STAP|nr:SE1832 family protein [Staphylococcus americanisciuri]MCS4486004.1 SE1832 family protein [Staphylococcus americanisciuri]